ncbi:hypothetical protein DPX16_1837 [Anabarilius grahami]|uniref:Uncharacterized protein n=1 Tax=Anabarilius grahami TaxID=495550 RepID=A0A3N0Z943_ANAGA|nr:hypothetical protein DPX16_1837 [Anabarilius grahami]
MTTLSAVSLVFTWIFLSISLLNGFYLPPARAWAPIVPFLADLFLELIESVQRSSALESKSLCVDGVGRSVTLNNRKTLQLIPSMTDSSPVPYVNDAPVNMSQSMGSIQLLACGPAILSNMTWIQLICLRSIEIRLVVQSEQQLKWISAKIVPNKATPELLRTSEQCFVPERINVSERIDLNE